METTRSLILAVALLTSGLVATPAPAATSEPCAAPSDWVDVPGQGLSCRVGGLWMLRLDDGSTLLTHGPDAPPPGGQGAASSGPRPPFCVPADEPHQRIIYARAVDRADRFATMAPQIRSMAMTANGQLFDEGQLFGAHREFRFLCDPNGAIHVDNALIPVPSPAVQFQTIVNSLSVQGFQSNVTKYWVWYDRSGLEVNLPGGQGTVNPDDRLALDNANNRGRSWAVTYGYTGATGAFIMLHESGHTLGAVQNSAPHSSGAFHCNDGQDVMCYNDGGPKSNYQGNVCPAQRFDCNHDDYFHPSPAANNYLALHWNLGSAYPVFIHHPDATIQPPPPPPPPGDCEWSVHGGELHWTTAQVNGAEFPHWGADLPIPDGCPGHPFRLNSTSPTADFDVCWLLDGSSLGCDSTEGDESGTILGWANTARIWLRSGSLGEFDLVAPA